MAIITLKKQYDFRTINFYKESVNILLYVANDVEFSNTISWLQKENKNVVAFSENNLMFHVGKLGFYTLVVVNGGWIGQSAPNSCVTTIHGALKVFKNIDYLITVGVCGGFNDKVSWGDVIIAKEVKDYESQKIGEYEVIDRSIGICSNELSNIIANKISCMSYDFQIHFGKIISGNKLVNNKDFSKQLQTIHKEALGLDMEAYAISRAAIENNLKDWIFIKSVSDFTYDKKGSDGQSRCVKYALQVLENLLSDPDFLKRKKIKILISGAFVFNDPSTKDVEQFVYKLTQTLINENYKIVSGYGKCVGNAVVAGAYNSQNYLKDSDSSIQDILEVYPFPRVENTDIVNCLENIKYENRQLMCKGCSFSLFVFGKKEDGSLSQGMEDEFRLAQNMFVVPIGATGYKANELWDRVNANSTYYFPDFKHMKSTFASLNAKTQDELIYEVVKFLKDLQDCYFRRK